ncbi:MAG: TolC family protein [Rhodospirillales bacterium]
MRPFAILLLLGVSTCAAEVHTLTLRQAVDLALKQSPEVVLARLDEVKAEQAVKYARDPFIPKLLAASGLAYSSGFPMSIEGATPSIIQARAVASVFNKPLSFRLAAARENQKGAAFDAAARRSEVAYRTAELYVEAQRAAQMAAVAGPESKSLEAVLEMVRARVGEGRDLPIALRRAELSLARARYREQVIAANMRSAQSALAAVLGLDPEDEVRPADTETAAINLPIPDSADEAVKAALAENRELKAIQARLLAKGYDIRAERAAWMPQLDLVAQYALLARFNNYDEFFRKFQRNNGQLGISVVLPLLKGPASSAAVAQAEAEAAQLRTQFRSTRQRIEADTRRAYEEVQLAQTALEIARTDLEVARDQVSILLAQMQEGRAPLRDVEEARVLETDKWIALYDARANLAKARLALLKQTGDLLAALR